MSDQQYLQWPFLEDHHRNLALELDEWAAAKIPPLTETHEAHDQVDKTCRQLVRLLGKDGWLRYAVPAAYGGIHKSLDVRSLCLIREILARYSGLADFAFAMQGLGSGAISTFGSEALKERYLPAVASGERIAAFALSEKDAGSDVAAMQTHFTDNGATRMLQGEKTWISNGGIADFYTVVAREGHDGRKMTAAVVDAGSPGFSIAERIDVIAPHPLATIRFDGVTVNPENVIGEAESGMRVALGTLDIFRTTVGAAALGFARRALDEATERALSRNMFGATLADQPIAQQQLAEMALEVDASALLIYRSAWTRDVTGRRVTREAAMAKLYATDQAQRVIDRAVQLFGGLGVKRGSKVEELYREVRALRIYEGASEVQKIVIARQHLSDFQGGSC
ncbi:MAG: acyl-CoA dehydrogenase family protein [Pseudomonadota bacterium]